MPTGTDGLDHVRWIGGGTGGGKSTIARRLAAAHGLRLHELEPFDRYDARTNPDDHPLLHRFIGMSMDERWLCREPEDMLATFHGYQDELFDLMVGDVRSLPVDVPVLVEGFSLLPRLMRPLLGRNDRAVWLAPTPEFRRAAFESRGSLWGIAGQTSAPPRRYRVRSQLSGQLEPPTRLAWVAGRARLLLTATGGAEWITTRKPRVGVGRLGPCRLGAPWCLHFRTWMRLLIQVDWSPHSTSPLVDWLP